MPSLDLRLSAAGGKALRKRTVSTLDFKKVKKKKLRLSTSTGLCGRHFCRVKDEVKMSWATLPGVRLKEPPAPQTPLPEEETAMQYPGDEQHESEVHEEQQKAGDDEQVSGEEKQVRDDFRFLLGNVISVRVEMPDETEEDKENKNGEETKDKDKEKEESKTEEEKGQEDEDEESDEEDISDTKEEIVEGLKSQDKRRQLIAAEKARHLLSSPRPPVNQLIDAGVLPPLVLCMARQDAPELQLESAWAVTNIASGKSKHTNAVVGKRGAIKVLIQLLSSQNTGVREQAVWALGNIVGDGPDCRDRAIEEGIVRPLVGLLSVTTPASIARQVCWVITNLFRVKHPVISPEERKMCAEAIRRLVAHFDAKVQADSLWAAAYFADMGPGSVDELIECGAVKDMVQRLYSQDDKVVTAALRATGSIAAGANHQTEAVVSSGALPIFRDLLGHPTQASPARRRDPLERDSWHADPDPDGDRRAGGARAHEGRGEKQRNEELQKEASWALCNMVSGGTEEQIAMLVSVGAVSSLCHLLKAEDGARPGLEALSRVGLLGGRRKGHAGSGALSGVFAKSQNEEATARLVEGVGGLETLRGLQSNQDPKVAQAASTLLSLYFGGSRRSSYGY
nr:importin subunit alpha-4-like [Penaeus vannamei]